MMLRKILPLFVLVSLSLVACDENESPPKEPLTPERPPTNQPVTPGPSYQPPLTEEPRYTEQELQFLSVLRNGSYSDEFRNDSDARLLEGAYAICSTLDSGVTTDEVIGRLQAKLDEAGASLQVMKATGYLLGASVATFCPEYRSSLE